MGIFKIEDEEKIYDEVYRSAAKAMAEARAEAFRAGQEAMRARAANQVRSAAATGAEEYQGPRMRIAGLIDALPLETA